ncbi:MAG: hypothetical protein IJE05_04405 [Clostridia bacterium]|nr:hypothetical protein [Clostridia bacterium]
MQIITNNIEKECWDLLSLYEDIEYVKEQIKLVKPKIKQTSLKKVASEINLYIKQANELYNSNNDSIITSPLTLFYSINNLVKAVYLLKNPTNGIKASHGLSLNTESGINYKLNEISVHINNSGTFCDLNKLLNNNLPENIDISLNDVLKSIPELSLLYNLVYGEEPNIYLMKKNLDKSYEYKVELFNNSYEQLEKKDLSLLSTNSVRFNFFHDPFGNHCHAFKTAATENINNILEKDIYNNIYLTLGISLNNQIIKIHQLNAIYILFYVFSMELRYRAYEWINIINSKEKAIIKKAIEELKVKMLVCILSLIMNEELEFTNRIENYKEDVDYSKITDEILKEIKKRNRMYGRSIL